MPWTSSATSGRLNARLNTAAASTARCRESGLARSSRLITSTTCDSSSASAMAPFSPARCNSRCTNRPTTGPKPGGPSWGARREPPVATAVTGTRRRSTLGRQLPNNVSGTSAASSSAGIASESVDGEQTAANVCERARAPVSGSAVHRRTASSPAPANTSAMSDRGSTVAKLPAPSLTTPSVRVADR